MLQLLAEDGIENRLYGHSVVFCSNAGISPAERIWYSSRLHPAGQGIRQGKIRHFDDHPHSPLVQVAAGEYLPYVSGYFDLVLSHEVIEHVQDDRRSVVEMVRVLKKGGRAVIFCPNRLYPFETHGHYWRGQYHFGNTPLINYLPNSVRNKIAPHVRAYTTKNLKMLVDDLPVTVIKHTQIYPGYDNIVARRPAVGRILRKITYTFEQTPLRQFGLSHLLVIEKR